MLKWKGDVLKKKVVEAQKWGIDKVMSECVIGTKGNSNHPGWINRTGTAEGSVRIVRKAQRVGKYIVGVWGSVGFKYVLFLELYHGSFLRSAADAKYKNLAGHIKSRLNA